jgi:hypothetical protein
MNLFSISAACMHDYSKHAGTTKASAWYKGDSQVQGGETFCAVKIIYYKFYDYLVPILFRYKTGWHKRKKK